MKLDGKKAPRKLFALSTLALMLGLGGFLTFYHFRPAEASMAGWDAGNIMSDFVMSNKGTMNAAQIDAFIDAQITCNYPYNDPIRYYQGQCY